MKIKSLKKTRRITAPATCPAEYLGLRDALADNVADLHAGFPRFRRQCLRMETRIHSLQKELNQPIREIPMPEGTPEGLRESIRKTIHILREGQQKLLEQTRQGIEVLAHARENEDRLVILVFGEVNSGKTGVANHVAGLDFQLPPAYAPGDCFVAGESVARLKEAATEETREFQGYKLPGLLWIDCPGVLSMTAANAELAHRLVARADFILLVSSSDAPFKQSEMRELRELVRSSGNQNLDAFMLITKSDRTLETVTPKGDLVGELCPKTLVERGEQAKWCREIVAASQLDKFVAMTDLLAISTYIARDRLGRNVRTGALLQGDRGPRTYDESGYPELFRKLGELVQTNGAKMKAKWPAKRRHALKVAEDELVTKSTETLGTLKAEIQTIRDELKASRNAVEKHALTLVQGKVAPCIRQHGSASAGKFDAEKATLALHKLMGESVRKAFEHEAEAILEKVPERVNAILAGYVSGTSFSLPIRDTYRMETVKSPRKVGALIRGGGEAGGAIGGGIAGEVIGAIAGSVFGPVGTVLGGILGGLIGGAAGAVAGRLCGGAVANMIPKATERVKVHTGTNEAEVIAKATEDIEPMTRKVVAGLYKALDGCLFKPVLVEVEALEQNLTRFSDQMAAE